MEEQCLFYDTELFQNSTPGYYLMAIVGKATETTALHIANDVAQLFKSVKYFFILKHKKYWQKHETGCRLRLLQRRVDTLNVMRVLIKRSSCAFSADRQ